MKRSEMIEHIKEQMLLVFQRIPYSNEKIQNFMDRHAEELCVYNVPRGIFNMKITEEDYKKAVEAVEKLFDLIYDTDVVTARTLSKANQIYNEAELLILDNKED